MKRILAFLAVWLLLAQPVLAGETVKRGPGGGGGGGGIPGLTGSTGNDATLAYLTALDEFQAVSQIKTQIWFDPYEIQAEIAGTSDGTYDNPYASVAKMKDECQSYTRCTVKGEDRVFSPLTLLMTALAVGEDYYAGESLSWTTGTGTVLAWYPKGDILVINRDTGSDPTTAVVDMTGGTSGAIGTVSRVYNTVAGHTVNTFAGDTAVDPATDAITVTAHSYQNGEGPMRLSVCIDLFNIGGPPQTSGVPDGLCDMDAASTLGVIPTGLLAATNYYICDITANTFTLDTDSACTGASVDITADGAALVGIAGLSSSLTDDAIAADCLDTDRICILYESEYPEHPALIDGNRFHTTGYTNRAGTFGAAVDGGLFYPTSPGGGWVGVQNIRTQNIAIDSFSDVGANTGKLLTLNTQVWESRNATENRTSTIDSNNCYTSHGTADAAHVLINPGTNRSRTDSASSNGACGAWAGTAKVTVIGGLFQSVNTGANSTASFSMTGTDLVAVGTTILGDEVGGVGVQPFSSTLASDSRLQFGRVLVKRQISGNDSTVQLNPNGNNFTVRLYETTIARSVAAAFASRGLIIGSNPNPGSLNLLARGLLMDEHDIWLDTVNDTTSITNSTVDLQGNYDDADSNIDTNEWYFAGASCGANCVAATVANARADVAALGGTNWTLYTTGSVDSNNGVPWGTDTTHLRCQSTEECWEAYQTPYTIDLTHPDAADPNGACIPADVVGSPICTLRLTPTHIGAR